MRKGIFTWIGYHVPTDRLLCSIKYAGFQTIMLDWTNWYDVEDRNNGYIDLVHNIGLEIENVHLPFKSVNQIWLDNLKGEEIAEIFQNDITLAAERSIPVLVIHSSNDNAPPVSNIGLARFRDLIDQAARLNVKLAFENLRALEHLHAIFDCEDVSRAGMCYDIGHNHCYTHDDSLLARYSNRILAVHLHDNDGCADRHLIPFDGTIDWKAEMETLGKSSYPGSINLEISGHAQEPLEERLQRASMAADRLIALCKRE